ncbi:NDP-hexose 2,3-dehydratase family protein [Actinomadura viridis]|uniref:NDP-hexose 2,3-dehydratase family protein n=1 Tax=Actinomadura viridis TaxID=58110 RepID=UPI00368B531B
MNDLDERVARSERTVDRAGLEGFRAWFAGHAAAGGLRAERIPFDRLRGWRFDPGSGDLRHDSGAFFSVEGLRVRMPGAPVEEWSQPIIRQPEIGILGILAKEFDGVLHFLMQAKTEPGNHGGAQLSPTVQATRSNYTRRHGGRPVPYLEYFQRPRRHRVLADVRQSEQGCWFYRKRNRNMITEVTGDVPVRPGFRWLTLGELYELLAVDDLVNMDARSVLACLPVNACDPGADTLSWITDERTLREVGTEAVPLRQVERWRRTSERIRHDSGRFFDVIAVDVRARDREVSSWTQPMIEPRGQGVSAFLLRRGAAGPEVLVHARAEPGYADVVELAPTVQCTPPNYGILPGAARPPYLDEVLAAPPERVLFESVLSEEGGRFYHARNRYLIVETDPRHPPAVAPHHRWTPVRELAALIRHSHYVNVEARTLLACLRGVQARAARPGAAAPLLARTG